MQEQESAQRNSGTAGPADVDLQELLDDPELERLHRERIAEMQQEAERRAVLKRKVALSPLRPLRTKATHLLQYLCHCIIC